MNRAPAAASPAYTYEVPRSVTRVPSAHLSRIDRHEHALQERDGPGPVPLHERVLAGKEVLVQRAEQLEVGGLRGDERVCPAVQRGHPLAGETAPG